LRVESGKGRLLPASEQELWV